MNKKRPFLKWAGNKYNYIEKIMPNLKPAARLIEPFTGSAAVFLNSDYPAYLLAESNQDLVDIFQLIQTEGLDFINYCKSLFVPENNCQEKYYLLREEFNQCVEKWRRAALFLYLNKHGYNGLCRYNLKGIYNVPFGQYDKPYFPHSELIFFHQHSQKAVFLHHDFRHTFTLAEKGDIIYCDPPYVPLTRSANFTTYSPKKFTNDDQIDLVNLAKSAAKKGITVVISNNDTEFTRAHYQAGKVIAFNAPRSISCIGSKRNLAHELIAIFQG